MPIRLLLAAFALALLPGRAAAADPPVAWKAWAARFMNATYGSFDARSQCWLTKPPALGERYCMRVLTVHWGAAAPDGGPTRLFLLAGGHPVDAAGQPLEVNALPYTVGAFVAERRGAAMAAVSAASHLSVGSSTNPPQEWQFVEVGPGVHGWLAETGGCQQGVCTRRVALLAPRGNRVVDNGFPVAYSDAGRCGDARCEARATELEMTFETDESAGTPMHALRVRIAGRLAGRALPDRPIAVPFDTARWAWRFPPEPAIAKLFEKP